MPSPIPFKIAHDRIDWTPAQPVERLQGSTVPALVDPAGRLAVKLARPDSGPSLPEYLRGKSEALIVVSDHTRAVGYPHFLAELLNALNQYGLPDAKIALLVAVGLHDPQSVEKTVASLTADICRRVAVHQHLCKDSNDLRPVSLPGGKTVRVNRRLVESGIDGGTRAIILTGGITFHYHAGFGGGRKAVFPGCAAYEDVLANHKLLLDANGPRGRNANCQPGRLDGNPIYAESIAVLQACPPMFLVNTVLASETGIAEFFTGNPIAAHRIGCEYLHKNFTTEISAPADLVVAGAGGAPKDATLYQAHKAYDNASRAVRSGGALVLIAGLAEGLGPAAFRDGLAYTTIDEHRAALFGATYTIPSQTCLACREKAARARTWLVGPPDSLRADLKRIGFEAAATIDQAVAAAREYLQASPMSGRSPRTLVLPDAGQLLPVIQGQIAAL